ncbi:MAG: ABC transporter permease [Gemmatimonadales bacterium]
MIQLLRDTRLASRLVARAPALTLVAIVTLALGIGANTAVFSVLNRVILRPLDYHEPDRLVRLHHGRVEDPEYSGWVTGAAFLDFRESIQGFENLAAIYCLRDVGVTLTGDGAPQRATMFPVSADFFDVYHVSPILGRTFHREEERSSARIAILSHRMWTARWGGDPGVIGTTVMLDDVLFEIVGVMPRGFVDVVGGDVDLWIPLELQDANATQNRGNHYLGVIGRLRSGTSFGQAQSELHNFSLALEEQYVSDRGWRGKLEPLHAAVVGTSGTTLYILMGAAGLVLLISCVNVASLLLARNVTRQRELAIRSALGSGRGRLIRQLLTESLLLSVVGGVVGVFIALWGVAALIALIPDSLPRATEVAPDGLLLLFAVGVTLFTALLAGLVPAMRFTSPSLDGLLHDNTRGGTASIRTRRLHNALVISQVALAVVLLVGAGLLAKSFLKLQRSDLGMQPGYVHSFEVHLPPARYGDPADRIAFHQALQDRMAAIPGVTAAGAVSWLPVSDEYNLWSFTYLSAEGEVLEHAGEANFRVIEGDYFAALGIRLSCGRLFERTDDSDAPLVAIINETLANRYYEGRETLGELIQDVGEREWRIVGVVDDVAHDRRGSVTAKVYLPHAQFADDRNWAMIQVVATASPRDELPAMASRELAAIDPGLVIHNVQTLERVIQAAIARDKFTLSLLGVFAVVALTLAAVGLYGVLAYSVSQRTREIGIRMALGANVPSVRRAVARHTAQLAGTGILAGLLSAFVLSRLLGSILFEVDVRDPSIFSMVPLVLAAVAGIAWFVPARRATRVDPAEAMRVE